MSARSPRTDAFWAAFCRDAGIAQPDYAAFAFGDGPALATELAELVVAGKKRATASLARQFGAAEPMPRVGEFAVVVDGSGAPRCVIRTTEIRLGALGSVDDRFAWDEGEGDRTRDWWLAAHRRYFARMAAREGFVLGDDEVTVFERFEVVWPAELA